MYNIIIKHIIILCSLKPRMIYNASCLLPYKKIIINSLFLMVY